MSTNRLVVVDEWSGRYVINEAYRPIAEGLVRKFPELVHIAVKDILFIDNTFSEARSKGKVKYAQIGQLPDKIHEIIYQMTGRRFCYLMEFFKLNMQEMSREQIVALVYHELRHIGLDGSIVPHEIEDWQNMHHRLGSNWASTKRMLPDLLLDDIEWDEIKQPSLFEHTGLKVIK